MNARKTAILLAVTALSVVTLFIITLIDGKAFGATDHGLGGLNIIGVPVIATEGGSSDLLAPCVGQDGQNFKNPPNPVVSIAPYEPKEVE